RAKARRELDEDGLKAAMAGKSWDDRSARALIDEDPRAYKDIDVVMEDQRDLVTIDHTLTQILNYKGVEGAPRRRARKK
ncbi:MAG: RtcB family protein, partial [Microthrixaceae bacterium]